MFGADATMQAWYDNPEPTRDKTYNRNTADNDRNNMDYLFQNFSIQRPWLVPNCDGNYVGDDFILIAEFSEQEGPRPLIVIPKDGGQNFDKNEFSVKILSVDHQSSFVEGCHSTEDAQVVMSDTEKQVHAFVHHLILNDIQARGYVRPFCISYVTSDERKLMACYEDLSQQIKKVARLMKYGNRLVFMRDLEKHQEDLSYTKARLLITQKYMTTSTPQGDSDLLNVLNALRQSMEEVRDILAKLKPLLNDHELEERFQQLEKLLKISVTNRSNSLQDSSSLKDFDYHTSQEDSTCGSFTDTLSPEFSLFNKSKDLKPKFLDVSIIKGKRRFDRSLRGLHELCSWGAKDGLQRLRHIREFFRQDLSSIEIDDMDSSILAPDSGVLSFGTDCIGANFLSSISSLKGMGWKKSSYCRRDSQDNPVSLGSLDSFKSLSSSFQSFVDEEMYSAKSSMIDTSNGEGFSSMSDRFSSRDSIDIDNNLNTENHITDNGNIKSYDTESPHSLDELDTTLNASLLDFATDTIKDSLDDGTRPRTSTTISEFDVIDKDIDVKCSSRVCGCSKEKTGNDYNKKTLENFQIGGIKGQSDSYIGNSTVTMKGHSADYEYHSDDNVTSKTDGDMTNLKERVFEADDSLNVNGLKSGDKTVNMGTLNVDSFIAFSEETRDGNASDAQSLNTERHKINKYPEHSPLHEVSAELLDKSEGFSEAFLPHTQYSINEISSDLAEANVEQLQKIDKVVCDINETNVQTCDKSLTDCHSTSHNDETADTRDENSAAFKKNCDNDLDGIIEVFQPHLQFSINEDISDISEDSIKEPNDSVNNTQQDLDKLQTDNAFNSDKKEVMGGHVDQIKLLDVKHGCENLEGEITSDRRLTDINVDYSIMVDKFKEESGPINGLWRDNSNVTCSSTEKSLEDEPKHRRIRRKWKLYHPLRELADSKHFKDHGLLKVLTSYNNLQHVIYSLLSGRPVVVIGTRKHEAILKELLQALNVFVPVVPGCDHVSLLCQIKQLKVVDVHKFLLRGIIRSEKKCLDYIVPQSLRRYITLFDVEKSLISCIPYQGSLLSYVSAIYNKKKVFKTEQALHAFIQMCLMEISSKAFSFYHCMCIPDMETNYVGVTLTRKSSMLELSADKYLNKAGLLNADSRLIKHLAEIVKIQQIDEEFKCRSLTESPVYPFNTAYNSVQTFRC